MTPSPHARARARRYAMQALYQWDMSGTATHDIRNQFLETEDFSNTDREYFVELFNNITKLVEDIDNNLAQHLDIPLPRLDPVERAILRIGTYELLHRLDIPYRVVINEAVQLAKKFGAEQGHTFVNGVLDKAAHVLRATEYNRHARA
ncbi:MAG: transcription antitermination factor NusB [Pseudomonadota bacterium]